jgi:FkbM family methyltransferase
MLLKQFIKRIPVIGRMAHRVYAQFTGTWRLDPALWIPKLLPDETGTAVQIGSNDGKTGDPLYHFLKRNKKWRAVFVEPVPYLFERLKKNYSGDHRFGFENAVIADDSQVHFYWVSQEAKSALPGLPSWFDQLAGLSREHICNQIPELEPFIQSTPFPGMSLTTLFHKHGLERVDLLHIDTEGQDYKILRMLDLERFNPRVILYERKHLSLGEEESSVRFLQPKYELYKLGDDILALNRLFINDTINSCLKPLSDLRIHDR